MIESNSSAPTSSPSTTGRRLNANTDDFVRRYGAEIHNLNNQVARVRHEHAPLNDVFADIARASVGQNPVAAGRIEKVESPGDADFPNLFDSSPESIDKTYDWRRDIDRGFLRDQDILVMRL